MIARSAALALVLAISAPLAARAEVSVPQSQQQIRLSFAPVVKRVAPAVVNIRIRAPQQQAQNPLYADPFYRRFFGEDEGQPRPDNGAVGSGVILRENGLVVTNHHVVKSGGTIDVILNDKRTFTAKLLLSDERTDLAVLQVDAKGEKLPFLELRDSDEVEVGDLVLAIGNPFGVGQTVTSGIVSAVARTSVSIADFRSFIQTDAPINPGNSGGALVTLDGKLAGINTAILSRSGGNVGIGFAIPSNMVGAVVRAALTTGRIARPTLGIGGQDVTADIARARGLERIGGVIVSTVQPDSPAAHAGIKVGDVILKINGRDVNDIQDLRFRLATMPVGGKVKLTTVRGRETSEIEVELREAAAAGEIENATTLAGNHPLAGAAVVKLSPGVAEQLGVRGVNRGVVVVKVQPGSAAARRGFRAKDVVVQINGENVNSAEELRAAMTRAQGAWQIVGVRDGNVFRIVLYQQ
ncbi:MAG: Do family serine endopeptidase [Candidatus Odyssella sp.]|nr:Do family serine endopeptidase [Candidatus Odyssella sp.]